MNRTMTVVAVVAFLLGTMALSRPPVRTVAQGTDASPISSPVPTSSESPLAIGLPEGVAFADLVSGQVDDLPDAPAVLRLERLTFGTDADGGEHEALGPEILYVEDGAILITDEFGFEAPLVAGEGVLLRPGSAYEIANYGFVNPSVLRMRVVSAEDAQGTAPDDEEEPDASPVAGDESDAELRIETLLDGEVNDALPEPGVVFLAQTTWAPGAETGDNALSGPTGILVESGTLTVTSPSGIEGQVREGRGVVLPAGLTLRARNAETADVQALLFGVAPAGGGLIQPAIPTATPTIEPTVTEAATSTVAPTPTVPPTPTSEPTATSEPTSIPTPTPLPVTAQGTILQMGETWDADGASLTVQVGDVQWNGVDIFFIYRNLSESRVDFLVPDGFVDFHDDLRVPWDTTETFDDCPCSGIRIILDPEEAFGGGWRILPNGMGRVSENSTYTANVFVTFRDFGAITEAKWGFTIANGRILTLPPDAVDPVNPTAGASVGSAAPTTAQTVIVSQEDGSLVDQAGETTIGAGHLVYAAKIGEHWDLYRYNFANGKNRRLTDTPNNDEWAPAWAHDGETIAYLADAGGSAQVWLMDLFGRDQRQVTSYAGPGEVYYVAWAPDDRLLYVTVAEDFGARVLAMPATGGPLQERLPVWSSFPAFGPDGTMAYVTWANDDTDVLLADGNGTYLGDVSASTVNEDAPNVSADGTRIVYQVGDRGGRYVEFLDLSTGERRALPRMGDDSNPVWSPDGTAIACVVAVDGREDIYLRPVDGGEAIRLEIVPHDKVWYLAWSA